MAYSTYLELWQVFDARENAPDDAETEEFFTGRKTLADELKEKIQRVTFRYVEFDSWEKLLQLALSCILFLSNFRRNGHSPGNLY